MDCPPVKDAVDLFRKVEIFQDLADHELRPIVASCVVRRYRPHTTILQQEDAAGDVYFILQGAAKANCVSASGREVSLSDLRTGSIFGEFSAVDRLPRSATVTTTTEAVIAKLSAEGFARMLKSDGRIAYGLIRMLVEKVRDLSGRMFEISALGVQDRVRKELMRLSQSGRKQPNGILLKPAPTHYELAAKIGSHREAVTRELNRLARSGLIAIRRQEIAILDIGWLERGHRE
jgi:CRP-like cAMP-binding protein